jgi:hypothetical protein
LEIGTVGTPDDRLRFAIQHRRLIQFIYHRAQRIAEPHDYGVSGDRIRLLAFQVRGRSRGPLPGWRMFDVDRMEELVVLDETFRGSRGGRGQSHKQWDVLFCRVE